MQFDSDAFIMVSTDASKLQQCRQAVREAALSAGFSEPDADDAASAVFEACANAHIHGGRGGETSITLRIRTYPDRIEAVVRDLGPGLSCEPKTDVPAPTDRSGRGIPLMCAFMDEVRFDCSDGCTVTLVKYLPRSSG